jgi:hypothetical protein
MLTYAAAGDEYAGAFGAADALLAAADAFLAADMLY